MSRFSDGCVWYEITSPNNMALCNCLLINFPKIEPTRTRKTTSQSISTIMWSKSMWPAMRQFCRYQQVPIGRTSMQRSVSSSFAFLLSMRRALTMLRATRERWCDDVRIQSVRKATWYACRYRRMRLNAPSTYELFSALPFFVMRENLSISQLCIVHSYGDENTVVVCDFEIERMQKTTRKLDRVGMCCVMGKTNIVKF